MHPGGFKDYWALQWVNQGSLRAVKQSDADGWSTCGCRDLHSFYLHSSIIPTCSSVRGTSSSRARSLPRLPRRREEWEHLERPDWSAYINGIGVCLCGGMHWNEPAQKPCDLLLEPPISFCIGSWIRGPELRKDLVSCLKHTFKNTHMHFVHTVFMCLEGWLAPAKPAIQMQRFSLFYLSFYFEQWFPYRLNWDCKGPDVSTYFLLNTIRHLGTFYKKNLLSYGIRKVTEILEAQFATRGQSWRSSLHLFSPSGEIINLPSALDHQSQMLNHLDKYSTWFLLCYFFFF